MNEYAMLVWSWFGSSVMFLEALDNNFYYTYFLMVGFVVFGIYQNLKWK